MSANQFIQELASRSLCLDGALASELEKSGGKFSISQLWSASTLILDPEKIEMIHLEYFRAGADVVITSSYQASTQGLREHAGLTEKDSLAIIQRSVDLAHKARSDYLMELEANDAESKRLFVAGSVGPFGAYLGNGSEYRGDYSLSIEGFMDWHRLRIQTLVDSGVDVLALETIPSRTEALALIKLLEKDFPDTRAWISFTLKDASHISDGTLIAEIAKSISKSSSICAIGVNCVSHELADGALQILSDLKICNNKPLVVYPNSGEEWDAVGKEWISVTENRKRLEVNVTRWQSFGARLMGGCCRTGPEDIRQLAKCIEQRF